MKPDITEADRAPLWKRLAWFAAIWGVSVGALSLVAVAIRAVIA